MGNKIEKCYNICCYRNIKEQNMDGNNNVIYINPNQIQLNKFQELNSNMDSNRIKSNIYNPNIKQKLDKSNSDNQKITSQSTAMVSKKVSNKNLKAENLNINQIPEPNDKYFDKERIISRSALNESINQIQRIFQKNLIEKKKTLTEKEEIINKKMKIKRNHSEILPINIKFIQTKDTINETSERKETDKNDLNDIIENDEEDMKVSIEGINIFSTYRNQNKKKISFNSFKGLSSSSFYSQISSIDISQQPKGYFLYKQKKYKFYGNHIEGKKEGFGIIKWKDKSILKANFENSKINGIAQFIDSQIENSTFIGEYKENIPKGYGYYIKDNLKIEGDNWEKNYLFGIGMEIWEDDNFYQGEFNKGLKNGIGLYRWPDSTLCFGEWKNNKLNGYGLMKYSNDSIYIGEFKNSLMNGFGEFLWNDTEYYCGNYLNGVKHGFGIYVWSFDKLNCYVGFWENGKQNGVGVKIIENELRYGFYKDGRKTGSFNGGWESKHYLKPEQVKYFKFFNLNSKILIKFILGLENHDDLFKQNSFKI